MRIRGTVLLLAMTYLTASAQLRVTTVNVGMNYNMAQLLKNTFQKADGFGIEANVKLPIGSEWSVTMGIGYADLQINQDSAVSNWNWGFYIQPYSGLVSSILRDSTYKAVLQPNQHLYLVPVEVLVTRELPTIGSIHIYLGVGGSLQLYQRHLWLHEYWSKYYPTSNYTYSYDFNDDAGLKVGTMYALKAMLQLEYPFSKSLGITLRISGTDYVAAQSNIAYSNFPMKGMVSGNLSLNFYR